MYLYFLLPFVFVKQISQKLEPRQIRIIAIAIILFVGFNNSLEETFEFYGNAYMGFFILKVQKI